MSELDLSVPKIPSPTPPPHGGTPKWAILIMVLLVITIVSIWLPKQQSKKTELKDPQVNQYDLPANLEDIIIKLKKGGAYFEAAELLGAVANQNETTNERKARLLKQQGDLYLKADEYDKALRAYYFSELANQQKNSDLERDTTEAIISLLRKKGQYSAITAELATKNRQRLGQEAKTTDPIVAKIDERAIPLSDFDLALEKHIQQRTLELTLGLKDQKEKERIEKETRKSFHAPYQKLEFLKKWVTKEVLYQEALNANYDKQVDLIKQIDDYRKGLLIQAMFEDKAKTIQIDEVDLKNYVQTNRGALGLSTDPGQFKASDFQKVRETAESRYKEMKSLDIMKQFSQDIQQKHKVEIFDKVFTEGGQGR